MKGSGNVIKVERKVRRMSDAYEGVGGKKLIGGRKRGRESERMFRWNRKVGGQRCAAGQVRKIRWQGRQ